MRKVKSCGLLVVRGNPIQSFLLMRHPTRYDLPKGHAEPGETDIQCALRELEEETGITADHIELDPIFRFTTCYPVRYRQHGDEEFEKTLVLFLGRLTQDVPITPTEHIAYEWFRWEPPHRIQKETVDPLLAYLMEHLNRNSHHPDTETRRKERQ